MLLYNLNKSSNIEMPYWSYDRFDIDLLTEDDFETQFTHGEVL